MCICVPLHSYPPRAFIACNGDTFTYKTYSSSLHCNLSLYKRVTYFSFIFSWNPRVHAIIYLFTGLPPPLCFVALNIHTRGKLVYLSFKYFLLFSVYKDLLILINVSDLITGVKSFIVVYWFILNYFYSGVPHKTGTPHWHSLHYIIFPQHSPRKYGIGTRTYVAIRIQIKNNTRSKPNIRKRMIYLYGSHIWYFISLISSFSQKNKTYKMGLSLSPSLSLSVCVKLWSPTNNFQTSYPIETKFWLHIVSYRNSPTPLIPFLNFENCAQEKFFKLIFSPFN